VSAAEEAGAAASAHRQRVKNHLGYVDGSLKGRNFRRKALTGADIQMSFVGEMAKCSTSRPYPNLSAWLSRMHARPAFQRSVEKAGRIGSRNDPCRSGQVSAANAIRNHTPRGRIERAAVIPDPPARCYGPAQGRKGRPVWQPTAIHHMLHNNRPAPQVLDVGPICYPPAPLSTANMTPSSLTGAAVNISSMSPSSAAQPSNIKTPPRPNSFFTPAQAADPISPPPSARTRRQRTIE